MEPVTPFDWHRMFLGSEPPLFLLEIVFRVVVIYLFAVLLLRLMGKRRSSGLSPVQNVVIIGLGSATGDAMFYPQIPIVYAWVITAVVVGLYRGMALAQAHSRRVNVFVEGNPLLVIRDGRVITSVLDHTNLRPEELLGMLREQGIANTGEVRYAFLEPSGQLGIVRYERTAGGPGESTVPADGS